MWLGALTWLVIREYSPVPEGEYVRSVEVRLPPTTTFYALLAGSQQVGFHSVTTDTLATGVRVTARTDVDVPLPLVARRLLTTTEALYDQRLQLTGFTTSISGETGQLTLVASRQPDSTMQVVISGRGQSRPDTVVLPVPVGVLLPNAVSIGLAAGGNLTVGATAIIPVLDPVQLTVSIRHIRMSAESLFVLADSAVIDSVSGQWHPAGRDSVRAVRAEWTEYGMPVRAWIDRRGTVLLRETPLGLTERRGPYEIVNSRHPRRRPHMVQAVPLEITAPRSAPESPRRVILGGVDLTALAPMLTTPWQSVALDTLRPRSGPPLPAGARRPTPDSVAALLSDAEPSRQVVAAVRRAVNADTLPSPELVRQLATWIASTIVPGQPVLGGASDVLASRHGDSSNRAELLVAMAGALRIPARRVVGLLAANGRLTYRAWAEVWLDDWVPVDPTLGQFPADAGHFRLLINATARPSTLISMLGAVRPVLTSTATTP